MLAKSIFLKNVKLNNESKEGIRKKFFNHLLFSLLFLIFLDQYALTAIYTMNPRHGEMWPIYVLLVCQVICSPIQSGFSDNYCRKKSLILAVISTFVSVFFLKFGVEYSFSFYLIAILLKGILGNIFPLALAGIADVTLKNKFRFALALAICIMAFGNWSTLIFSTKISGDFFYLSSVLLSIFGMIVLTFFFQDIEDDKKRNRNFREEFFSDFVKECRLIAAIVRKPVFFWGLIAFFFSEAAFYQIFLRADTQINPFLKPLPYEFGIGNILGTIFIAFLKMSNKKMIVYSVLVSFLSLVVSIVLLWFGMSSGFILGLFFGGFSFGISFFYPALFSGLSHEKGIHDQGKLYGLLDSYDSLASFGVFGVILLSKNANLFTIFSLALLIFLFSIASARIFFKKAIGLHEQ